MVDFNVVKIKSHNKEIGDLGETIASNYLIKKGYLIIERNYLKKWGEIDIVARGTDNKVHFIEVKAVSYETKLKLDEAVTRRTWRPEENVHPYKLKKLNRAIESWLIDMNYNGEWQIDVIGVRIVSREKFATVKCIANVVQ